MKPLLSCILNPSGKVAKWLVLLLLIAIFGAGTLGYLEPVKKYLGADDLAFTIASVKLTPYKVIETSLVLIVLLWLASALSDASETYLKRFKRIRANNRVLVTKAIQIVLYFFVFLITLDILGIDLTALAVFSGAVGIGIGFGLQKITSNFISGLILLFEKSVEIDDLVELSDGTYGFVRHTGARYTLLETFESKEIMIPNEDFITSRVTNWTYSNNQGRIAIPVGVSYGSDIDKAHELILQAAKAHPLCSTEPEPECYLREFGDSSVNFLLYFWVDDVTRGRFKPQSEVMFSIWHKFKEQGIEIPFPQRDLHIKNPEALQ